MELQVDKCSQCDCGGQRPIVNRKYYLCDEKNFIRTHDGKTKQEVYSERAKGKEKKVYTFKPKPQEDIQTLKKKFSIKNVSSKKNQRLTDGSLVSQVEINRKYTEAIDKIKTQRPPVCQGSGRGDVPLSFSHTISRKRCKDLGKIELIWDPDNLEIEGYHEPTSTPVFAHNIWETGTIHQKVKLLNFERKLAYIKKHDPQSYNKWIFDLECFGYPIPE